MGLSTLDSENGSYAFEANALVVCAGTVTFQNVSGMGSGFSLFKSLFDYKSSPAWVNKLQKYIDKDYQKESKLDYPYVTLVENDSTALSGGVATVPVYQKLKEKIQKEDYIIAIQRAIEEAIRLKKILYIQPLGIGVYGWPAETAAQLTFDTYQKAIQNCSEEEIPEVQFLIYNQAGADLAFKIKLHELISKEFLEDVAKIECEESITSDSFILKETHSKEDKDSQLNINIGKLNDALDSNNQDEIMTAFENLAKTACKKRNWFSTLFFSDYSTSTHSAIILSEKFAENNRLIQALNIDNNKSPQERLKDIRQKMLEACEDKSLTPPSLGAAKR
ncbi:MAG: hypothetical protein LCH30_06770 [Proteobacteria bacterium]|nr:hypothetical protein [Pseudomonadota bacterium]